MLDSLYPPQPSQVILDIAPAFNALCSLASVADAGQSPGIGEWAIRTCQTLTQQEWERHRILTSWIGIEALSNAVDSPEALVSFSAFVRALADLEPGSLRDALLYWIVASPSSRLAYKPDRPQVDDPLALLATEEAFLSFHDLDRKSDEEIGVLRQVYAYMLDAPALQSLVTDYLDHFWRNHLREEWNRLLPELEGALARFEKIDTAGMSHFEVIETITRRNLRGVYRADVLSDYAILRFIPSFHCGPYVLRMSAGRELRICFGAHHLRDLARDSEDFDRAFVIDRMKAMADETRLAIIHLLKERVELGTQQIIDELNLSRSAASRHLRQLYANGIVDVRIDEDGIRKYYRLDPNLGQDMQTMFAKLLT